MFKKKLLLFDVDGTLVTGNRAHITSFSKIFKEIYNVDASIDEINHHGLTDKILIRLILERHNIAPNIISEKMDLAVSRMVEHYKDLLNTYPVKTVEGIKEFLDCLKKDGHILGLVTGNLEGIARLKLSLVQLWDYFTIGSFGSDGEGLERSKLVQLAIKRAEKKIGKPMTKSDVYMFGDTPRDIEAAKANGILAIGIACGIYSSEDLIKAGAFKVYKMYKDHSKIRSDLLI